MGWLFSFVMALLPLLGVSDYRKSALCLPFETEDGRSLGKETHLIKLISIFVIYTEGMISIKSTFIMLQWWLTSNWLYYRILYKTYFNIHKAMVYCISDAFCRKRCRNNAVLIQYLKTIAPIACGSQDPWNTISFPLSGYVKLINCIIYCLGYVLFLLIFNLLAFGVISGCYANVFRSVRSSSLWARCQTHGRARIYGPYLLATRLRAR